MKVVQINGGSKGSTGKIMFDISKMVEQNGSEVMCAVPITTTNRDDKSGEEVYRIGSFNSRRINVLLSRITGFNGAFAWFSTLKLLKKITEYSPDVIHLHNLHDSYVNLPMLFHYIKKKSIPVVWTLHDCWAFTGQCPYFTMVKCDKWKYGCNCCPQYKKYPKSVFDNTKVMWRLKRKWFTGINDITLVTPSEWLADQTRMSFLNKYDIQVINNGVDLSIFYPRNRKYTGIDTSKTVILGVAFGWEKRKGLDVFLDLANQLPEDKYQIVLVGTDNEVDKILPRNIISIHRTQNQDELAEIYSSADVLLNPSMEETFGMVTAEALACGIPVITSNQTAVPEVADDTCGIVLNEFNLHTVLDALDQVQKFNIDAPQRFAKRYDKNLVFKKYLDLYESMYGKGLKM